MSTTQEFRGIFPIVPTPFHAGGTIDVPALERVVNFCAGCGVHGLVWPAVASEFFALSEQERKDGLRTVIGAAQGRLPVVAGVAACSTPVAVELALDAVEAGASALMAMGPYVVKTAFKGIHEYFFEVCQAAQGRPVVLQNAPPPLGQALPAPQLATLAHDLENLLYIKEESGFGGHTLSAVLEQAGDALDGVMGGGGGRYLIDEHRRGACGAMPAADCADVFVALWEHLENDRLEEARGLFERILPLLLMQMALRQAFTKEFLKRRGVLENTILRIDTGFEFDEIDHQELDAMLARIDGDLRVK